MKEVKILITSMISNFIVSIMKIIGGIFCNSNSLIADGFHTFSDFITDIIAMIGSKISKKRANKKYPFGYGNVEYITSVFIGLIIFVLGVYIILSGIFNQSHEPKELAVVILLIAIIIKLITSKYLMKKAVEYHSQILLSSSKESFVDVYSSLVVLVTIFISSFQNIIPALKYVDILGSIILGILIINTAIKLLKNNIIALLGKSEESPEITEYIKGVVNSHNEIEFHNLDLIKNGSYYQANIEIECKKNINVRELLNIQKSIKKKIKNHKIGIRFIDIDIVAPKKS